MTITVPYSLFEDSDSYQEEYELTPEELTAAYREEQHNNDISDVYSVADYFEDYDSPEYVYLRNLVKDEARVDKLARRWREAEDEYYSYNGWMERFMEEVRCMMEDENA